MSDRCPKCGGETTFGYGLAGGGGIGGYTICLNDDCDMGVHDKRFDEGQDTKADKAICLHQVTCAGLPEAPKDPTAGK